jgi:hypothetical protein
MLCCNTMLKPLEDHQNLAEQGIIDNAMGFTAEPRSCKQDQQPAEKSDISKRGVLTHSPA